MRKFLRVVATVGVVAWTVSITRTWGFGSAYGVVCSATVAAWFGFDLIPQRRAWWRKDADV